ncbi:efflux RND transporter periplasmic adaptor subunit [Thalassotalea sp. PLHSN55]|uniref:efflux RND transporter periplasmic adaptor subunit n=1 Tax=Thalassotalea sp. PLHSN55 TaxID=3435888 RepID=UPI003F86E643
MPLSSTRQWFAQRPYIIAIIISLLLIFWMASGVMKTQTIPEKKAKQAQIIPKVQVETRVAEHISDLVELYGRTEPDRIVTLKSELDGQIVEVLAKRGSMVKTGQIIAKIEVNDLELQLARSQALLAQREMEYSGAKKLNKDGYQGQVQLSIAFANLQAVKADIKRLDIALENTLIRAPFDGVLNSRYVEQGDYVKSGDQIAMIADLNPLVVRAHVTENQIERIAVGQQAQIRLLNRHNTQGEIRYIASVADENTNTFKIEVNIPNENNRLLAGISAEVNIPLAQVAAIKISPALLALDAQGNIGVKTVENNQVKFTPIDIVKTESDGIWLAGLGEQADIITLGQGFVREHDTVEAVFASSQSKQAASSDRESN